MIINIFYKKDTEFYSHRQDTEFYSPKQDRVIDSFGSRLDSLNYSPSQYTVNYNSKQNSAFSRHL